MLVQGLDKGRGDFWKEGEGNVWLDVGVGRGDGLPQGTVKAKVYMSP